MSKLMQMAVLGLLAGALLASDPAFALTKPEARLFQLTNQERTERGIRRLDHGWRLNRFAQRVANRLAREGELRHSSGPSWCRTWGENIGAWVGRVGVVHRAFMRSPSHRANILNRSFQRVGIGIGIARGGGVRWVAVVFCG